MQLGKIYTAQADLSAPQIIEIEVDISNKGIPAFTIVGMADKAIDESRERINAALKNCGLVQPKQKKTIVSLSPADLRKEGPLFDLPIALGFLLADSENDISFNPSGKLFVGELALDGSIKPIKGALCIAQAAQANGFTSLYVPEENVAEAALLKNVQVFPVKNLIQTIEHLTQEYATQVDHEKLISPAKYVTATEVRKPEVDFCHIVEQTTAKRALEIAAAGGHNIALYGPPGTGKSMLAKAFCGILPPLDSQKIVETTMIHSYAGVLQTNAVTAPPFRAPHHTSSYVAVIGGGTYPKPGEITLAHNGVLFLDELPEFDKRVLESLREPLEERLVRISRAQASVTYPADFILIAALNPPSAVYQNNSVITAADERKFQKKLSGPIMDRIDMWVHVPKVEHTKLLEKTTSESSKVIASRVCKARIPQQERNGQRLNSSIRPQDINRIWELTQEAKNILNTAAEKLQISPRVYHKLIKLARTIADLDTSKNILEKHMLEAIQYRPKDIL